MMEVQARTKCAKNVWNIEQVGWDTHGVAVIVSPPPPVHTYREALSGVPGGGTGTLSGDNWVNRLVRHLFGPWCLSVWDTGSLALTRPPVCPLYLWVGNPDRISPWACNFLSVHVHVTCGATANSPCIVCLSCQLLLTSKNTCNNQLGLVFTNKVHVSRSTSIVMLLQTEPSVNCKINLAISFWD
jgi:hypothetical protein